MTQAGGGRGQKVKFLSVSMKTLTDGDIECDGAPEEFADEKI